ncbi:MAG: hypothetical protein LBS65_03010 [Desulfovibrio sp.]|jgi:hypothetical protein|nr:hypothetical protein [Desulfovibrio sp.]
MGLQTMRFVLVRGLDPTQASARTDTPPFRAGSGYPAWRAVSQTVKEAQINRRGFARLRRFSCLRRGYMIMKIDFE